MVSFFGDYDTSETVVIPFNSFTSDDPAASITLTNLANTDVYIYKDGSLTQRTSAVGVAVDVDVDGIAGNHWVTIDLSDNTDAGFYVAGSRYQVRIEGVTIDAGTINAWIGAFSIGCMLRPTVAGRTLDVSATGEAGLDWANVGSPTTTVGLTNTTVGLVTLVNTLTTYTGNTLQTGDSYALANGVTGFAAIDTVVDAILVNTSTDIPAAIGGIGTAGGASISVDSTTSNETGGITGVTSGTTLVGTSTATSTDTTSDYLAASVVDGEYHIITHAANAIDVVYQFLTGGGTEPVAVDWTGYLASVNDTVTISAWDHVGVGWEAIGSIAGTGGTTNSVVNPTLFTRHRGTSAAELGKVYIRLHCTGQSSPVLSTDQLIVEYAVTSRSVGYANGSVWIDTVSGIAGTESFVSGVADNPVLTIADALTIATAVNLRKFEIGNGSTITLAATFANNVMEGHEWILELGGQNVAGSIFVDASVSGTGTGSESEYQDCVFAITSLSAIRAYNCSFTANTSGGFTMSAAGDYRFINCQSGVPGASAPLFTLGTGAVSAEFRRWSGGITFAGITSDDVITISGEMGTIDLGSPSGAADIQIRGIYKAITNVGSATVNVAGALLGADVASILVDTATTIPGTITTAQADLDILTGSDGVIIASGTQTFDITGSVTGNLSGSVGSVTGAVGSVTGHTAQTGDSFAIVNGTEGLVAIDTVVDAVKVVTDQFAFTAANQVDANALAIDGSAPAAANLKQSSLAMQTGAVQTAEAAANTNTVFDTNLALENADYYGSTAGGLVIAFVSGTAQQFQTRRIVASATGSSNTRITLEEALDGTPTDADTFIVLGRITELS